MRLNELGRTNDGWLGDAIQALHDLATSKAVLPNWPIDEEGECIRLIRSIKSAYEPESEQERQQENAERSERHATWLLFPGRKQFILAVDETETDDETLELCSEPDEIC